VRLAIDPSLFTACTVTRRCPVAIAIEAFKTAPFTCVLHTPSTYTCIQPTDVPTAVAETFIGSIMVAPFTGLRIVTKVDDDVPFTLNLAKKPSVLLAFER